VITSIALLRGINVGGSRKLPMADLRAIFAAAGYEDVTTYIQSGNVVFRHPKAAQAKVTAALEARIEEATGMAVPVVLRTAAEMAAVVRDAPFEVADPTHLHVAFFAAPPAPEAIGGLDLAAFAPEELVLSGRDLYLHLPNGMGRAKLPQLLGKVMATATARNWRTVTTLAELASDG